MVVVGAILLSDGRLELKQHNSITGTVTNTQHSTLWHTGAQSLSGNSKIHKPLKTKRSDTRHDWPRCEASVVCRCSYQLHAPLFADFYISFYFVTLGLATLYKYQKGAVSILKSFKYWIHKLIFMNLHTNVTPLKPIQIVFYIQWQQWSERLNLKGYFFLTYLFTALCHVC